MIVDSLGRQFRNLRVSLTAACNYACTYCVPNGKRLQPARHELSAAQLARGVTLLQAACGIDKLRITGGEPLLSPKLEDFLPRVMALGMTDVAMTTNAQLLERRADLIVDSGIRRLNVSLDTLDPERFRAIARSGDLATVLRGIELMRTAGLKIKINMVPMRRANLDQVLPMLEYALERNIELRFIELMNMGHLRAGNQYLLDFVGMQELLELIGERYAYARADAAYDSTAVRFQIPEANGSFGIIANESAPFCQSCTRLRLASNGRIYGCLSNANSHDMTPLLELPDHEALQQLQPMMSRALADKQNLSFAGETTVMKFIGG